MDGSQVWFWRQAQNSSEATMVCPVILVGPIPSTAFQSRHSFFQSRYSFFNHDTGIHEEATR